MLSCKESISNTHIFTHKKWNMISYIIEVSQKDSSYTWVSLEQLTNEYAIPSAFQPFLKEIEK